MAINITQDAADRLLAEIIKFESEGFGVRCGWDFPEFARIISLSTHYHVLCKGAVTLGVFAAIKIGADKANATSDPSKVFDEAARNSPISKAVMDMLYMGYRLGLAEAECRDLNKLAEK